MNIGGYKILNPRKKHPLYIQMYYCYKEKI
jgi:hypothetical protein